MAQARGDCRTGDLLSWEPPKVTVGFADAQLSGNRLASKISRAVALALKDHKRGAVAARMSQELGSTISADMLDAYASEAKEGHKITLERFVALVEATGCHDLLGFVAGLFDHVVVPARYAPLIELHLIEEHEAEVARRRQALEAQWKAGR